MDECLFGFLGTRNGMRTRDDFEYRDVWCEWMNYFISYPIYEWSDP